MYPSQSHPQPGPSATAKQLAASLGRGAPAREAIRMARSVVADFGPESCSILNSLSKASEKKSEPCLYFLKDFLLEHFRSCLGWVCYIRTQYTLQGACCS